MPASWQDTEQLRRSHNVFNRRVRGNSSGVVDAEFSLWQTSLGTQELFAARHISPWPLTVASLDDG
jgi:hypothetical protein